ncbi:triose-phosphate isomerase [Alteromonas pelagimontana]|uniref:Triosephosphate isomerase n=1 Tax=Alteromonas pelagimontana TaxID=1858656 RepID=A0A6M4MK61_9ALTE|nr:triose-phosphate isomerase [Alteromonas pelagimontana]QJR82476.1 triose-phosphate isomerase [Alteromonas pelagimontana]
MNKVKRKPLVAANWKMNGDRALVEVFTNALNQKCFSGLDVVLCPPFPYLSLFNAETFSIGGQDISHLKNGAHTGDVSVAMLQEMNCKYVIVGHSERREHHGETNEIVAEKAHRAVSEGLIPIICVGESLEVRKEGFVERFITEQLQAVVSVMSADILQQCVIAYEPIWAIGSGETATPEQAQEVHAFIRGFLADYDEAMASRVRIIYGGSAKPSNATELFKQTDVDGGLIGGASLNTDDFIAICQAAI